MVVLEVIASPSRYQLSNGRGEAIPLGEDVLFTIYLKTNSPQPTMIPQQNHKSDTLYRSI